MCVVCRNRLPQTNMLRLQCKNGELVRFDGDGRSFYLCKNCSINSKKIKSLTKRFRLSTDDSERFVKYLKELDKNG